jgi:hypothetical protein
MASCTGKPKFKTETEAQKALRNTVPGLNSFYACQNCGNFHLGEKPASPGKGKTTGPARRVRKAAHYARR